MDPMDYIGQYQQLLGPWHDIGLNDFKTFSGLSNQMATNPVDYYNNIMGQYMMSPYAQMQKDYINQDVANQAAKGGYLGTPQEMTDLQGNLNRLIAGDQQQYYQDVMQPQQEGMHGLQYDSGLGFAATNQMGRALEMMAQMEAAKQAGPMQMLGQLAGMGMGGLMKYGLPKLLG